MESVYIRRIVVDAAGGTTVEQALVSAFVLSYKHRCDVEVVHNDSHYVVERSSVDSFLCAVREIRVRGENDLFYDAEARPDIKEGGALRTAGKRTACPSCKSHNVKCRGSIWNCEDCGERW